METQKIHVSALMLEHFEEGFQEYFHKNHAKLVKATEKLIIYLGQVSFDQLTYGYSSTQNTGQELPSKYSSSYLVSSLLEESRFKIGLGPEDDPSIVLSSIVAMNYAMISVLLRNNTLRYIVDPIRLYQRSIESKIQIIESWELHWTYPFLG